MNSEKTNLERTALDKFLNEYNRLNVTTLKFKEHQDKPDFLVEDSKNTKIIGIEVKDLFYDEDEAKILLGRSDTPHHSLMNSNTIIEKLNECLVSATEKAQKYKFNYEMFLLIRVASPIFDISTFDIYKTDIVVPPNIFSEIWLIHQNDLKKLK
ncbi:MAG: hypothetical protein WC369_06980 [Dehalococcoidales bacterium]|jgi:hypothetical protein